MEENKKVQPKLTLTYSASAKEELKRLGQLMLAAGYEVQDEKRGGVSLSAVVRVLVQEKLAEIEKP